MKLRYKLYLVVGVLVATYLLGRCQRQRLGGPNNKATAVLSQEDTEQLRVNSKAHTITIITKEGTKTSFLPSSGAAIDVLKNGQVRVSTKTFGFEREPFLGFALGSDVRAHAALGLNLFYLQRWEVGAGLLLNSDVHDTRAFAQLSYNVYDNCYLAIGIDNRKTAQLMVGLKF